MTPPVVLCFVYPQSPCRIAQADVTSLRLTVVHEHVILGSPGLWSILAPDDAALRCHFYLKERSLLSCVAGNLFLDLGPAVLQRSHIMQRLCCYCPSTGELTGFLIIFSDTVLLFVPLAFK